MFTKGTRFPVIKPSEVPGPNTYNTQEPEYDMYKRGAFLEKTDRFKEKASEVPGPGTYTTELKPTGSKAVANVKTSSDRYTVLQRKVEDLERLYADGKKSHANEVDRLKSELTRVQKANSEHSDRVEKLKKQNDLLDARVQELKRSSDSAQAETKELRSKLRASEHERNQLSTKQGDLSETKKALQALDGRRRDELRERDRKIAELEKSLASEKKKRELLEAKLSDTNIKAGSELQTTKDTVKTLQAELQAARIETQKAKDGLVALQAHTEGSEEDLLMQLEQHRLILSRVAEEYGRLASSTISKAKYDQLKSSDNAKQLRIIRLERKLANTEGQVTELAHLIRSTKDESTFLSQRLKDVEYEALVYSALLQESRDDFPYPDLVVVDELFSHRLDFEHNQVEAHRLVGDTFVSLNELQRLTNDHLLLHASSLLRHVDNHELQLKTQADKLVQQKALQETLSTLQNEKDTFSSQLAESATALAIARGESAHLKKQLEEVQNKAKTEVDKARSMVAQEKQIAQKLAVSLQEAQAAESALKDEVEQLTADLAEAEIYQEAYGNLVEEVDALIQRNALAEEETQRVSRFNAEILGHHNPAQKIMYVDRIRRELFDTKQKLLMTNREREAVIAENEALQHELTLYKSVAVHPDDKPRTAITRVARIPLGAHNVNVNSKSTRNSKSTGLDDEYLPSLPEMEYKEGDMTIDELS